MSRRRAAIKRKILPDAKFGDFVIGKFINCLMKKGKKSVSEKTIYAALDIIGNKTKQDSLVVFKEAIDNVKPNIEVRSRRVGGATYQVPMEVREERRQALAIKWLIGASRNRGEKTMRDKLAGEIIEAFNKRGTAMKKREDTHKMAEANKAFAHYRW